MAQATKTCFFCLNNAADRREVEVTKELKSSDSSALAGSRSPSQLLTSLEAGRGNFPLRG